MYARRFIPASSPSLRPRGSRSGPRGPARRRCTRAPRPSLPSVKATSARRFGARVVAASPPRLAASGSGRPERTLSRSSRPGRDRGRVPQPEPRGGRRKLASGWLPHDCQGAGWPEPERFSLSCTCCRALRSSLRCRFSLRRSAMRPSRPRGCVLRDSSLPKESSFHFPSPQPYASGGAVSRTRSRPDERPVNPAADTGRGEPHPSLGCPAPGPRPLGLQSSSSVSTPTGSR
jgi:hypothetical protein